MWSQSCRIFLLDPKIITLSLSESPTILVFLNTFLKPLSKLSLSWPGEYFYSITKPSTSSKEEDIPKWNFDDRFRQLSSSRWKSFKKTAEKNYSRTPVPRYHTQELVKQRSLNSIIKFSNLFFSLIKHAHTHTHTHSYWKKLLKSNSIKLEYFRKN